MGSLPLLPYSSMIANCSLWFMYGMLTQEFKVWFTNLVGLCFGVSYFLKFAKYVGNNTDTLPGTVLQHVQACLGIILATSIWVFACYLMVRQKDQWKAYAAQLVGNAAVIFCLLMVSAKQRLVLWVQSTPQSGFQQYT